jgi:hypothetical protein
MTYRADNFQNAIKRLTRKIKTAIKYAAFSPRVVLTLYDMIDDYIIAHPKNATPVRSDSTSNTTMESKNSRDGIPILDACVRPTSEIPTLVIDLH